MLLVNAGFINIHHKAISKQTMSIYNS